MSGAPKVRSTNIADSESRPVLVPAGNKTKLIAAARKPVSKPLRKADGAVDGVIVRERMSPATAAHPQTLTESPNAPAVLKRQEVLLRSNFSMSASCSSDCSIESFRSRASTGRIGSRPSLTSQRRQGLPKPERQGVPRPERKGLPRLIPKIERLILDENLVISAEVFHGKRRCPWVTPNTEPSYLAFHDEEWGVPVHDDKKLFELLALSGSLAELTWPVILNKRQVFREVFMDFDPTAVAKLNEKKITVQGSLASTLLSEPKLRAVIENASQILKIIEEFGSFDRYCWNFVNFKPVVNNFRYPRQVPVKTPKADVISKDLVRRGFRCVGPTVIYSFMQAAGITNDHLISCYRFEQCCSPASASACVIERREQAEVNNYMVKDKSSILCTTSHTTARTGHEDVSIDLEFARGVVDL